MYLLPMHSQLLHPTTAAPPPGNEDDDGCSLREDSGEKIDLELGIGRCGLIADEIIRIKQEKKLDSIFSAAQFNELCNQIHIWNLINSGLPVPFHIWMSVFTSFGPSICNTYPNCFCTKSCDHTSSEMDTEPGRCKRTDGRKWRCSKSVLPHQKYCERHMYRGRGRGSSSTSKHNSTPTEGVRVSDENIDGLSAIQTAISAQNTTYREQNNGVFGSSPKSVLHNCAGKVNVELGSKGIIVTSPQRCRRTDGKKWQCRRDVLPNQKYCQVHMHRGAKRLVLNPESSRKVPEGSTRIARTSCTSLGNNINLNTVPASPLRHITENNSTSSSTSDATTITDENISSCLKNSF
ncbi:hypothetical protein ABFX02_02G154200 [Erythranthe guttata]